MKKDRYAGFRTAQLSEATAILYFLFRNAECLTEKKIADSLADYSGCLETAFLPRATLEECIGK